jgi:RND family efflux transporter MFP subunit
MAVALLAVAAVTAKQFTRGASVPEVAPAAARTVQVIRPGVVEDSVLTLPATLEGFQCTLLYPRVNGYVHKWYTEIGTHVKRGQVLADIDTPEADQDLEQARANSAHGRADLDTAKAELCEAQYMLKQAEADVARAKANYEYSQGVFARNTSLLQKDAISQQEFENSRRDLAAKQADIAAAEATQRTRESALATRESTIKGREAAVSSLEASMRRLEEIQGFKKIVAPFDGVVTRRRAEVGMLVSAGNPQNAQELFVVADADRLRIKISVPQSYAPSIEVGQPAQVSAPEYPSRTFKATVARTAGAIDPAARTLAVELELENSDGALLPGAYARVSLKLCRPESTLTVPVNALVSRTDGPHVAVVAGQGTVQLRKVQLGRDYGQTVEVLSGLHGDDSLVVNPPDDLADGEKVIVSAPPPAAGKAK